MSTDNKVVVDLLVDKIDDIKDSVSEIQKDISHLKVSVTRNTDNLEVHMRRTDLNEQRIKIIEERLSVGYLLKLTLSVATGIGSIAGSLYALIKVIDYFLSR
jgi:DNA repair ATPase RecN